MDTVVDMLSNMEEWLKWQKNGERPTLWCEAGALD